MNDFKGLYFSSTTEQKNYEFGAHFRYAELCNHLEHLYKFLPKSRKGHSLYNNENNYTCLQELSIETNANNHINKQSRNKKNLIQSYTQKLSEITKDKCDMSIAGKTVEIAPHISYSKHNQSTKCRISNHHHSNILIQEGDQGYSNSSLSKTNSKYHNEKNIYNDTISTQNIDIGQANMRQKNNFSRTNAHIPYSNSSFFINHPNIIMQKQNQKALYHLIKLQKKNNTKSISHYNNGTNEISSLSDLNNSALAHDELKIQGKNIIVQPKINISFVNNINNVGMPIEHKSRNIENGCSLLKMNTTIKKCNLNLYKTNKNIVKVLNHNITNNNTNGNVNSHINKTPSPMKKYTKGKNIKAIFMSLSKDKQRIKKQINLQGCNNSTVNHNDNKITHSNDNTTTQNNNNGKYFYTVENAQKKINHINLKSKSHLTRISADFGNIVGQKQEKNFNKTREKSNSKNKSCNNIKPPKSSTNIMKQIKTSNSNHSNIIVMLCKNNNKIYDNKISKTKKIHTRNLGINSLNYSNSINQAILFNNTFQEKIEKKINMIK